MVLKPKSETDWGALTIYVIYSYSAPHFQVLGLTAVHNLNPAQQGGCISVCAFVCVCVCVFYTLIQPVVPSAFLMDGAGICDELTMWEPEKTFICNLWDVLVWNPTRLTILHFCGSEIRRDGRSIKLKFWIFFFFCAPITPFEMYCRLWVCLCAWVWRKKADR